MKKSFSDRKFPSDEEYSKICFFLLYSIIFERAIVCINFFYVIMKMVMAFMAYEVHEHEHTQ